MLVSTEAIALSTIKYSESSVIFKCYTLSNGIKSYIIKGIRSKKSKSLSLGLFQPMTILEINANHKNNGGLENMRAAKILAPYRTIPFDIIKNSLVLFISEVLSKSILEEEKNSVLFNYIKSSALWLDSSKKYVNFHIQFLIKILKYLGISPNFEENLDFFENSKNQFDYSDDFNDKISRKFIEKFEFLLGTNFDNGVKCNINNEERKEFLEFLMSYMSIHIGGFRRPNSLNIMYELFKKE